MWVLSASIIVLTSIVLSGPAKAEALAEVVPRSAVQLQPLNPLRGDASPKAGVLWGDIRQDLSTGTLIEFVEGFSSPPHIHNITYRAVVISGAVHNDDPDAATMWMGPGSFWTQPAGETHITSAAVKSLAFLEILQGPYLVQPTEEEFDNGERPVNIEARNIIWLDPTDVSWIIADPSAEPPATAEMAFLWGRPIDGERNGTFLKLPSGFNWTLQGNTNWLRAVTIKGRTTHLTNDTDEPTVLEEGSYFGSTGEVSHDLTCTDEAACLLYVSTTGKYTLTQTN